MGSWGDGEMGRVEVGDNVLLIRCHYYQLRCSTINHPFPHYYQLRCSTINHPFPQSTINTIKLTLT